MLSNQSYLSHPRIQGLETAFYNFHTQVATNAFRYTNRRVRSYIEHCILLIALCTISVVFLAHRKFVYREYGRSIPSTCLPSIRGFRPDVDVIHIAIPGPNKIGDENVTVKNISQSYAYFMNTKKEDGEEPTTSSHGTGPHSLDQGEECRTNTTSGHIGDAAIFFSYSQTKGFLMLSDEACLKYNISVEYVIVSRSDANCFDEPFLQHVVFSLIGPETVIINWLLSLHKGTGYAYNHRTNSMIDLAIKKTGTNGTTDSSFSTRFLTKGGVLVTTLFLFFVTTTLVSFTLRETQDRMLEFTFHLQSLIRERRPFAHLIFTHVVENLVFVPIMVGIMFFLTEFYGGDKLLAFMVLSIVWVCEVFSAICIRSVEGMQYFPPIFFLLFIAFHIYFFSCPFVFSYAAFAATCLCTTHSMFFFWNRCELPALLQGRVSREIPRMRPRTGSDTPLNERTVHSNQQQGSNRSNGLNNGSSSFPSVSSFGRLSRPDSWARFYADSDDDGYMSFLNGEVVMHRRPINRSPSVENERTNQATTPRRNNLTTDSRGNLFSEISFPFHSIQS